MFRSDQRSTDVAAASGGGSRHAGPAAGENELRHAWRALSVVALASILVALNQSTLTVALPDVVRHFHAGAVTSTWILLAYMLANTALLVAFGRLADMVGRPRMYMAGMAVFTTASLLSGFAPGALVVIALRFVQGAGAAMILANSAAIVTDVFPRRLLNLGLGVYMASFSVAQLIGPSVGGFLVDTAGWQWVFWFNVPVGVACLCLAPFALRKVPPVGRRSRVDVRGNAFIFAALGALLFALSSTQRFGWTDPVVLVGFAVFVALLPIFIASQLRSPHPVLDVRLFRDRLFDLAVFAQLANTLTGFSVVLLMALFFQAAYGESPLAAGLQVMPLPIATMAASLSAGMLARRARSQTLAVVGSATTVVGLFVVYLVLSVHSPYPAIAGALALVGLGGGIFRPANTTTIMGRAPQGRVGIINAVRLTVQNVGVAASTAVSLALVTGPLPFHLRRQVFAGTVSEVSPHALDELLTGYHHTFLVMGFAVVLGTAAAAVVRGSAGERTSWIPVREGGEAHLPQREHSDATCAFRQER